MSKEAMKLALKQAFDLGQTYWSWADSEYQSHWKKADAAKERFNQLVEDTISKALAAQQTDWEAVAADQAMTIALLKAEQPATYTCGVCGVSMQMEQPAIKQDLTPEQPAQHQCKFPMCQSEEYQQVLAEQIKRELYTGEPAQQQEPVALREVGLTRDFNGVCIVTVNGREAIRDSGDIISHFATLDWFASGMLDKKPERDIDSMEVRLYNRGWNNAIAALYTSPPAQQEPLDAGEISSFWKRHTNEDGQHAMPHEDDGLGFARAIETAIGIKGDA